MNKSEIIAKILKLNLTAAILILLAGFITQKYHNNLSNMVINIGLLYMISMPVIRVLLELIYFIKTKNYTYIVICLLLFAIIAISIVY